jgi:hypothetical protein
MKLLTEIVERVKPVVLTESEVGKSYFIEGPFLQSDIKNRNGRIYPSRIMEREVMRYTKELINENRALGELGHPDSPHINLPLASHRITELTKDGKDYNGKAKILNTPNGNIVKALIDEDVKLGVSSRGLGSLTSSPEGNIVGEDFYLATAADIVADPSAPDAFVRGLMENRDWVWENGVLGEKQVESFKRQALAAPKKKAVARQFVEAQLFEQFLRAIRVSILK